MWPLAKPGRRKVPEAASLLSHLGVASPAEWADLCDPQRSGD